MSGVFPTAPQNPDTGPTVALTLVAEEKARTVRGRTRGTVARRTDAIVSQSMWEESLKVRSFAGITRDTCTPLSIFRCDARDISVGATIFKRRRYYVRVDLLSVNLWRVPCAFGLEGTTYLPTGSTVSCQAKQESRS